jgi:hypothetical protein
MTTDGISSLFYMYYITYQLNQLYVYLSTLCWLYIHIYKDSVFSFHPESQNQCNAVLLETVLFLLQEIWLNPNASKYNNLNFEYLIIPVQLNNIYYCCEYLSKVWS